MRLVLHIGTHKTATTSIQHYLNDNRALLAERGVHYPSYDLVGAKRHYAHLGMANALSDNHHLYDKDLATRFFGEVRRRIKDFDLTVISAEPFYRQTEWLEKGDSLARDVYWDQRAAYIARIAELMPEAEICVVFRRQVEYAQSLYQEFVKKDSKTMNFAPWVDDTWYHFEYLGQARAWAAEFPKVRVLGFEELCKGGSPEEAFCKSLGINTEGFAPPQMHNKGLHPDLVIFKRHINRFAKVNEDALARTERLATQNIERALARLNNRSFFANANARAAFQRHYTAQNRELSAYSDDPDFAQSQLCSTEFKPDALFGDRPHPTALTALLREMTEPKIK